MKEMKIVSYEVKDKGMEVTIKDGPFIYKGFVTLQEEEEG